MAVVISSSAQEKVFEDKSLINIGNNPKCDFQINVGYDVLLTVQFDKVTGKCFVANNFKNDKILFKGNPLGKIEVTNISKIVFAGTNEEVLKKYFPVRKHFIALLDEEWKNEKSLYAKTIKNGGKYELMSEEELSSLKPKVYSEMEEIAQKVFNHDKIEMV